MRGSGVWGYGGGGERRDDHNSDTRRFADKLTSLLLLLRTISWLAGLA
jgi:hypothetical protein